MLAVAVGHHTEDRGEIMLLLGIVPVMPATALGHHTVVRMRLMQVVGHIASSTGGWGASHS